MANETTTTTLDDLTHTSLIQPYLIAALSEQAGLFRYAKEFDLTGQSTKTASIPSETSWWGSANDRGAGVDTEFNATEATDLSNTAVSTGAVTISAAEYGVAIEVTDNVGEDSIDGLDMLQVIRSRMLHVLQLAMEDDFLALLASLSQTVGTSGSDLSIAQLLAAQTGIRTRGANAETVVYILDNQQAFDVESAFIATNAAAAVFALAADRILNYQPSADHGLSMRMISTFRGFPVWTSGLTDTANANADVVGACFVPSTSYNDAQGHTTFGSVWKRLPRFETQRFAKARATDLVMTTRWGCGEMLDGSGTAIITDA
jgi:hypothetical protein